MRFIGQQTTRSRYERALGPGFWAENGDEYISYEERNKSIQKIDLSLSHNDMQTAAESNTSIKQPKGCLGPVKQ